MYPLRRPFVGPVSLQYADTKTWCVSWCMTFGWGLGSTRLPFLSGYPSPRKVSRLRSVLWYLSRTGFGVPGRHGATEGDLDPPTPPRVCWGLGSRPTPDPHPRRGGPGGESVGKSRSPVPLPTTSVTRGVRGLSRFARTSYRLLCFRKTPRSHWRSVLWSNEVRVGTFTGGLVTTRTMRSERLYPAPHLDNFGKLVKGPRRWLKVHDTVHDPRSPVGVGPRPVTRRTYTCSHSTFIC